MFSNCFFLQQRIFWLLCVHSASQGMQWEDYCSGYPSVSLQRIGPPECTPEQRVLAAHWQISWDSTAGEDAQEMSPHRMRNGVHHVKVTPLSELGCGSLCLNWHSEKSMCGLCEEPNQWFWQSMPRTGWGWGVRLKKTGGLQTALPAGGGSRKAASWLRK